MRTLLLMRGTPGSGKSTFIQQHNLQNYTLEPDAIRLMATSPEHKTNGDISISSSSDKLVWDTLFLLLEERMKRGAFTVIDATHSRTQLINRYRDLCQIYKYRVKIIDFSDVPLATALAQNKQRPLIKQVPDEAIKRTHARLAFDVPSSWCELIPHKDFDYQKHLELQCFDMNQYRNIEVIGDIHGCYDALKEALPTINSDTMYIFVGDYLDRGIQNAEVFTLLQNIVQLPNTLLLEGNHEVHWNKASRYTSWKDVQTAKFPKPTKEAFKELETAGIELKELKALYKKLGQIAYFTFGTQTYVVTHGGIPSKPSVLYSTDSYIKGVGGYEEIDTIHKAFAASSDIIQIHGHRNIHDAAFSKDMRNYNLCEKVEFGGNLRTITIHKNGDIDAHEYRQTVVNKTPSTAHVPTTKITAAPVSAASVFKEFVSHKGVAVKNLSNDIYSINFTSKLFKSRSWCDLTTKARGLFLQEDGTVVARSYDKFFNYQEMPDTSDRALKERNTYPINVYQKENGFLGILSVHDDEFFIASKSTNTGPFAEMFKEVFEESLEEGAKEELKQFLKENNESMVFEVNHLNDPHMVEYQASHMILLDIIKNDLVYQKRSYDDLVAIALKFDLRPKTLVTTLQSYEDWRTFREATKTEELFKSTGIEGYVLEDANNFAFKIKLPWYTFWKYMRSLRDRVLKNWDPLVPQTPTVAKTLHTTEEYKVFAHMIELAKNNTLDAPIIDIRKSFLTSISNKTTFRADE